MSLMIGAAGFLAAFGLLVWYLERRRHGRRIGKQLLVGLPGVYLAFLATLTAWKWLYIPGLGLLAAYYIVPFVRQSGKKGATDRDRRGSPPIRKRRSR